MAPIDPLTPLHSSLFDSSNNGNILHGFFTRQGGVSEGIYHSLNVGMGSQDRLENITENRKRVAASLNVMPNHLLTLYQIHSSHVLTITEPFQGERPKADAMVTNMPGIALGILSADCGPVLFADMRAHVIGSAHAGWRGAIDGILENTVEAMISLGAQRSNIIAALGPTIGPGNYEVRSDFFATFMAKNKAYRYYFCSSSQGNHKMFDLWSFIVDKLQALGVMTDMLRLCTYDDEARFFSYRRAAHRGERDYGRQISAIMITE